VKTSNAGAVDQEPRALRLRIAVQKVGGGAKTPNPKSKGEHQKRRLSWMCVLALGILPTLALRLAFGAGYGKWQDSSARDSQVAGVQSVHAATGN
jgi:hypothetical protein